MTCDDGRPCSRCKKRGIEHLCRDELKKTDKISKEKTEALQNGARSKDTEATYEEQRAILDQAGQGRNDAGPSSSTRLVQAQTLPLTYISGNDSTMGNEINVLR